MPYACGNSELTPAYLDFEVGQSPVNVPKEWYAMRNRVIFPIRDEAGQLIALLPAGWRMVIRMNRNISILQQPVGIKKAIICML